MSDKKVSIEVTKEEQVKVSPSAKVSNADKIWSEIKDLSLDLFALPNQKVSMHVKRIPVHEDAVHLTLSSQAVLAALEVSLGSKYSIESGQKYICVKYSEAKV